MDFPKWPHYSEDEIRIVETILRSGKVNYWTGNTTKLFEKEFSNICECEYTIALANGSLALSCAYLAIGLKKGDEIITTPRSFIATTSSAMLLGAMPVFADIDRDSGNITSETIEPLINKNTKALVVVHIGGWPADIIKISKLAKKYNLFLIEDCSQAHGASFTFKNSRIPVGKLGDISTWSFCQDKIISTGGEGGMIATNNKSFYEKIWSFKDHGKSIDKVKNNSKKFLSYRYIHDFLGSNFRITNLQSGIGLLQLKKLKLWNQIRSQNAEILTNELKDIKSIRIPKIPKNINHAWYKFNCFTNKNELKKGWDRDKIILKINSLGYPAFQGSCSELYLEECIKKNNKLKYKTLPIAKELGQNSICFLIHPTITKEIMYEYSKAIKSIILKATK